MRRVVGMTCAHLRGRQVCADDFRRYDWILAMDRSVLEELQALRPPDYAGHLGLFLDLVPALGVHDVPDPYDKGPEGFERVLDLVEEASEALTARLAKRLPESASGRRCRIEAQRRSGNGFARLSRWIGRSIACNP